MEMDVMGTRGTYGFYKNNQDKLTYNHFDSYPSCLGNNIVEFIRSTPIELLNDIYDQIILVDKDSKPTEEQINECIKWYNSRVSTQSIHDWYCLLRKAQGNPEAYKEGLRYMIEANDFIKDSLWCEWGYIINLDNKTFEVYKGFQKEPNNNRYACKDDNGYYNCKLVGEFPLDNIPENWIELLNIEVEGR